MAVNQPELAEISRREELDQRPRPTRVYLSFANDLAPPIRKKIKAFIDQLRTRAGAIDSLTLEIASPLDVPIGVDHQDHLGGRAQEANCAVALICPRSVANQNEMSRLGKLSAVSRIVLALEPLPHGATLGPIEHRELLGLKPLSEQRNNELPQTADVVISHIQRIAHLARRPNAPAVEGLHNG